MLAGLTAEERQTLIEDKPVDYGHGMVRRPSADLHHGLMMELRNYWGLWNPDAPIVQSCLNTYGVSFSDDVSGLIMDGFLAKLRGKSFDAHAAAERYKEHWRSLGCDPATGKPLEGRNQGAENLCLEVPYGATSRPGGLEAPRKRGKIGRLFDRMRG